MNRHTKTLLSLLILILNLVLYTAVKTLTNHPLDMTLIACGWMALASSLGYSVLALIWLWSLRPRQPL